jgi:hypothetical protein
MLPVELHTSIPPREAAASAAARGAGPTRKVDLLRRLGRKIDAQDPAVAREAAALMTSQLFFAPVLAEMRKFPFGKELGSGGRMEEAFGEQLDQHIADIVARSDRGLTAELAERLASGGRLQTARLPAKQPAAGQTGSQAGQAVEGGHP